MSWICYLADQNPYFLVNDMPVENQVAIFRCVKMKMPSMVLATFEGLTACLLSSKSRQPTSNTVGQEIFASTIFVFWFVIYFCKNVFLRFLP